MYKHQAPQNIDLPQENDRMNDSQAILTRHPNKGTWFDKTCFNHRGDVP